MDLIDRYVREVGAHLPYRLRSDVEAELRSLLMDALEERARAASNPSDAELAAAVLRDFGPPHEVARRYAPQSQYLIGPRLFPAYKRALLILAVVVGALFLGSAVLNILGTVQNSQQGVAALPQFVTPLGLLNSLTLNFALITLAFAFAERVMIHREAAGKVWEPHSLPRLNDPDRVSPVVYVVVVYLRLIVAVAINFYPQWVGYLAVNHGMIVRGVLRPEFSMYLPWLNAYWVLDLAYDLWILRLGRRTREARWAHLGLDLLSLAIVYLMISGPVVFYFDRQVKQALSLIMVIVVVTFARDLYRLLARGPLAPWNAEGISKTVV